MPRALRVFLIGGASQYIRAIGSFPAYKIFGLWGGFFQKEAPRIVASYAGI